jgi:hypothetical protein
MQDGDHHCEEEDGEDSSPDQERRQYGGPGLLSGGGMVRVRWRDADRRAALRALESAAGDPVGELEAGVAGGTREGGSHGSPFPFFVLLLEGRCLLLPAAESVPDTAGCKSRNCTSSTALWATPRPREKTDRDGNHFSDGPQR